MTDSGWVFMGLKFNWFIVLAFIIVMVFLIFFLVRPKGPRKHVDRRAGDEGED